MKLRVERSHAHTLASEFPELAALTDQLRFGAHAEIALQQLSPGVLDRLGQLWEDGAATPNRRTAQLDSLRHVLHDHPGERFTAETLEKVVPAFVSYIAADARCGWLFSADTDSQPLAWCPTRIDYTPASNDETGKVLIELKANAKAGVIMQTLRLTGGDVKGRSVPEMLLSRGLMRESAALMATYETTVERYFDWRAQSGAQFEGRGTAYHAQDPSATHRDVDWMRKDVIILSAQGGAARLVNDEGLLQQRNPSLETTDEVLSNYLSKAAKSNHFDAEDEVLALHAELQQRPGLFKRLPVHPLILMFHLDLHHHVWVHVNDLEPYAYQPQLKHKLVLPPEQTDLIDILTAEMDVLMDDIIAGKSGGTTVLCAGPPGVGKTLTADAAGRRRIWQVMGEQFALGLDEGMLDKLPALFPAATGRDIKGLAKLVAKYCHHKQEKPTRDVFLRCAMFRGLDPAGAHVA